MPRPCVRCAAPGCGGCAQEGECCSNEIDGEASQQLAAAALGSNSLEVLSEVPIKDLRADTVAELDLREKGLGLTRLYCLRS